MTTKRPLILFSHGQEGTPDGLKIRQLTKVAQRIGYRVESLDYRGMASPDKRAEHLIDHVQKHPETTFLVGSSMGAYISVVASEQVALQGLFLLAPALYLDGYRNQNPTPRVDRTTIIHGWRDSVVPVANVIRFAETHRSQLHLVDADHRLLTAMPFIEKQFALFLENG